MSDSYPANRARAYMALANLKQLVDTYPEDKGTYQQTGDMLNVAVTLEQLAEDPSLLNRGPIDWAKLATELGRTKEIVDANTQKGNFTNLK